ncbi:hypothetical protein BDV11DRAFT_190841 [Aspergillus similis]
MVDEEQVEMTGALLNTQTRDKRARMRKSHIENDGRISEWTYDVVAIADDVLEKRYRRRRCMTKYAVYLGQLSFAISRMVQITES